MERDIEYEGPELNPQEITSYEDWKKFDIRLREQGVYAPMPPHIMEALVDGEKIAITGRSHDPMVAKLLTRNQKSEKDALEEDGCKIRNKWIMSRPYNGLHGVVYILEDKDGICHHIEPLQSPSRRRLEMWIKSMAKQRRVEKRIKERVAKRKLNAMLSEDQQFAYELTDTFAEHSRRSNVVYMLRKGRPTIAFAKRSNQLYALCALCLHPLAYYEETWTGVLVPSDEVIAHLLYIRGDEHNFWKRANHIPYHEPNSGV